VPLALAFASVVDSAERAISPLWHWNRFDNGVVMATKCKPSRAPLLMYDAILCRNGSS
jgi:hypothetical protein